MTRYLNESDYAFLPKLFVLDDDYYECVYESQEYCKILVEVKAESSKLKEIIEITRENYAYYDHSFVYFGMCFNYDNNEEKTDYFLRKIKENLSNYDLSIGAISTKCLSSNESITMDITDLVALISIFTLLVLVLTSSITRKLQYFSFFNNWKYIHDKREKEYGFIEGLRSLTMIIIIILHELLSFMAIYNGNPEFIETLMSRFYFRLFLASIWYIVQVYFLLSAMFLTKRLLEIVEHNGKLTLYDVFLIFTNRVLRLLPVLTIIFVFQSSHIPTLFGDGIFKDVLQDDFNKCRTYWYLNLFFLNNYANETLCNLSTWYLSVDTQLFFFSLLIFYLTFKFEINVRRVIFSVGIVAIIFNLFWIYHKEFPATFEITPKSVVLLSHFKSEILLNLYLSTYSNIASYMIGLLLGLACFKQGGKLELCTTKTGMRIFWYAISFGFPLISVAVTFGKYSRFTNAVLGALVKVSYNTGVAFFVYGLMQNENLFLRKVFEWKPLIFLGNFTYSTYLNHFLILTSKFAHLTKPFPINMKILCFFLVFDIFCSYLYGAFMFFLWELPAQRIQKRFVPNVKIKH